MKKYPQDKKKKKETQLKEVNTYLKDKKRVQEHNDFHEFQPSWYRRMYSNVTG